MQAITATLIGVLGTGFISVFLYAVRSLGARFDRLEDRFDRLEDRFDRLDDRVTGQVNGLQGQIIALGEAMHKGFKEHGERLARIEAHLEIDPPAEAA